MYALFTTQHDKRLQIAGQIGDSIAKHCYYLAKCLFGNGNLAAEVDEFASLKLDEHDDQGHNVIGSDVSTDLQKFVDDQYATRAAFRRSGT